MYKDKPIVMIVMLFVAGGMLGVQLTGVTVLALYQVDFVPKALCRFWPCCIHDEIGLGIAIIGGIITGWKIAQWA